MPVAGVMSARARCFDQGIGGLAFPDEDFREESHVCRLLVKVRGSPALPAQRVPLPERFRSRSHRSVKDRAKPGCRDPAEYTDEPRVVGRPQLGPPASPRPLPLFADQVPGAAAPSDQAEQRGAMIGDPGVVLGRPTAARGAGGPFFRYLADSLGREVAAVFYYVRAEEEHLTSDGSSRASRSSRSAGKSGDTRLQRFSEPDTGLEVYPFVPGMQILIDLDGDTREVSPGPPQAGCTGCIVS